MIFNMKKLFLLTAAAVATAVTMASCNDGPSGDDPTEGKNARMNVVVSFPRSMGTRAGDTNASDKDTEIESVTVFVFDEDGNGVLGNATTFDFDDFNEIADNEFELKTENRIQTTAGPKRIYVGINLPADLASAANETVLIESASTVGLEGTNSVAMLSELVERTLVSQEESDAVTPGENNVPAEVRRLVSKIAVTLGEQEEFTIDNDPGGTVFTVIPDQFSVGGLATTFYPVERLEGGMLETPGDEVDDAEPIMRAINPEDTPVSDRDAFYVPEHTDMSRTYSQRALTHVVVRAEFTFDKFATVGRGIEYVDANAPGYAYVFRFEGNTYVCSSSTIADVVVNELTTDDIPILHYTADTNGKFHTYYHLFLNGDESDMYAVYRNQFFDITVTGARSLGGLTIIPPDEPLVETTYLEVSVDVLEWEYKPMNRVLGE